LKPVNSGPLVEVDVDVLLVAGVGISDTVGLDISPPGRGGARRARKFELGRGSVAERQILSPRVVPKIHQRIRVGGPIPVQPSHTHRRAVPDGGMTPPLKLLHIGESVSVGVHARTGHPMPCFPTIIHTIPVSVQTTGRREGHHGIGLGVRVKGKISIAPLRLVVGDITPGCGGHPGDGGSSVPLPRQEELEGLGGGGLLGDIEIVQQIRGGGGLHHRPARIPTVEHSSHRGRIHLVGVKAQLIFA